MSTYGKDTPMERPDPGQRAAIFTPKPEADEAVTSPLRNGAGLVGFGNPDGSVMVYFEGNKFNDSSLHLWESKIFKAYDRMAKRMPTVNKFTCDAGELDQIGFVNGQEILVMDMAMLADWLERSNAVDSAPAGPEIQSYQPPKRGRIEI